MENNTRVDENVRAKLPIIENDSLEQEIKEQKRLLRAAKRTNVRMSGLPVVERLKYEDLVTIVKGYSSIEKEKQEEKKLVVSCDNYLWGFLVYRILSGKNLFSMQKFLHAADVATIVSKDQTDVTVTFRIGGRKFYCDKMKKAIKQLNQKGKICSGLTAWKPYTICMTEQEAKEQLKNMSNLEKALAFNVHFVYEQLENKKGIYMGDLINTHDEERTTK